MSVQFHGAVVLEIVVNDDEVIWLDSVLFSRMIPYEIKDIIDRLANERRAPVPVNRCVVAFVRFLIHGVDTFAIVREPIGLYRERTVEIQLFVKESVELLRPRSQQP